MLQSINRELVPLKLHYFLYNAGKDTPEIIPFPRSLQKRLLAFIDCCCLFVVATAPMVQFLPTIGKQLGFSSTLVGTIYAVLPISGLIAKPLFGSLADKFKLHKVFFLIFQAVLTIAFFSVYFIPEIDRSANVTLICHQDIPYLTICPEKEFSKKAISAVILENIHSNSVCQVCVNKLVIVHK